MEYDDPKIIDIIHKLNRTIEVGVKFDMYAFVPWIPRILPKWLLGTALGEKTLKDFHAFAKV